MLGKSTLLVMVICMILSGISFNAYGNDKILIMPKELVEIAEINGYEQVDDFYNLPGMLEPCYIYGYKEGDQENSAVFWVKKKGGESEVYTCSLCQENSGTSNI
ncbi:MAG: hypothetical protein JSU85_06415 [Candidatus Zixiibacteriota bacterium]|nr:MAG: hypothetical protein JSU85_06415 [candidate division Zixibacteria bacterium]